MAGRAYRLLLHAYPRPYRARFGAAMADTFLRDHARVHAAGRHALAGLWVVTIVQALWFGVGERLRRWRAPGLRARATSLASGRQWPGGADVRYALRLLVRSPLFAVTAIASLAIGLAATTVVFGLADALLITASPGVRDGARIVDIARTTNGGGFGTLSYPAFQHLRAHTRTLEAIAATTLAPSPLRLSDGAASERVYVRTVSGNFFAVLGVRPALGRFFGVAEDEIPDARPVIVLSHRYWRERFRADPRVIDRPLQLNDTTFTVIGVAEAGFENTTFVGTDLWMPMAMAGAVQARPTAELLGDPRATWHMAIGRLRPGVTVSTAQAELNTLFDAFRVDTAALPASHGVLVVRSGRVPPPVRRSFAGFVGLLFVLTSGLLAIACSNVAGLLLARATVRHREMATRLALGASRGRLISQMLTETLVLFAAAALSAVPLTVWLARLVQTRLPTAPLPMALDVSVTGRGWLFASGIALATAIVFGLAPARHALAPDVARMLHGRSSTASRARLRLRHGLVIAQVGLALALATTAGLFLRTLQAVSHIDAGFRMANVDIVSIETTLAGVRGPAAAPLVERVVDALRAVSGVEAVGHARMVPLRGGSFALGALRVPGVSEADLARLNDDNWDVVSPDYFRVVGLPMVAGRAFTGDDRDGRPMVVIVNEAFARVAWPGRSAVGQRVWQVSGRHDDGRALEVIGVAGNAKYRTIGEPPRPFVYVPFAQQPQTRVELFVKHAPGQSIASDVRAAIRRVEPGLPVVLIQSFEDAAAAGMLPQRLAASVASGVGSIGIMLAALGLYGLVAFLAAQRTREIAIRIALGASKRDVRSMVLGEAARLGAMGGIVGVVMAAAFGRLAQGTSLLIGVHPRDPLTWGAATLLMGVVLFAASAVPAWRATSTDPATALRAE
jgi:predicted permease